MFVTIHIGHGDLGIRSLIGFDRITEAEGKILPEDWDLAMMIFLASLRPFS